MTGMIEWGQKSKPKKSLGLPTKPEKITGPKINPPKKSHAEFPSLKNFQKALNDVTRKIKTLEIECLFVYSSYHLKLSFSHLVVILTTLETPKTANIKTAAKQVWLYFFLQNYAARIRGHSTTNVQIVLNTPKNPYLNQATPKNTCQFSYPKRTRHRKFKPKKILLSSLVT